MSYINLPPTTFKNLIELSKVFQDELVCRKYLENILWGGKPICPKCKHEKVYCFPDQKRFKCANKDCYKIFTVTVGTYLESTKIPIQKWFHAVYIFSSHKKGISSCQLFSFRLSTRKISERSRFDYALSSITGRLLYSSLIAPNEFPRYPQISPVALKRHKIKKEKAVERGENFLKNNKRKGGQNPTSQD